MQRNEIRSQKYSSEVDITVKIKGFTIYAKEDLNEVRKKNLLWRRDLPNEWDISVEKKTCPRFAFARTKKKKKKNFHWLCNSSSNHPHGDHFHHKQQHTTPRSIPSLPLRLPRFITVHSSCLSSGHYSPFNVYLMELFASFFETPLTLHHSP